MGRRSAIFAACAGLALFSIPAESNYATSGMDVQSRLEAVREEPHLKLSSTLLQHLNEASRWCTSSNGTAALHALRGDLVGLLNASAEWHRARGSSPLIQRSLEDYSVDYETGKITGSSRYGNGSSSGGALGSDAALVSHRPGVPLEASGDDLPAPAVPTEITDPALLHLDVALLRDMVCLSLAAAIGGLLAASIDLPHSLGFILGGMLVGPSCMSLITRVVQTETLAQFGSIFMLFGHGLMYSHCYRSSPLPTEYRTNVTGGCIYLACFYASCLALVSFSGLTQGWVEGSTVAFALTLSSTSVVMETLSQTKLRDCPYGRMVMEMLAVQDLFVAPLLALPAVLSRGKNKGVSTATVLLLAIVYSIMLIAIVLIARQIMPQCMQMLSSPGRSLNPSLFTMAVTSYCLGLSLVCEWFDLSHEAGALIAGLVLVDSPHAQRTAQAIEPLASLFGGIYLASLGMIMSPVFLLDHLGPVMAYVAVIYLLKVLVITRVVRGLRFAAAAAMSTGVIMAQISEVSLFFIARAHQLGLVSRKNYLTVLAVTVTLLAVTPLASAVVTRVDRRHFEPTVAATRTSGKNVAGGVCPL
uniref:Cation/H+ exchanger transmembrane domain-containing protein n=1 Tax=Rhizochromulina marina TaxID=1034831 RepID=A0A7S2WDJ5_9STRA|mmetsp:Transcript_20823/g.60878  ORF Transcript_20823/g.60878 Transcript_20823/m.60878 type:complete len:586 (+) Transcript_20823:234-1991(+)